MKYGTCECGGKITEKRIRYVRRFKGELFEFENVPVGVCMECGERVFKGIVLEKLEKLIEKREYFKKEIIVPVVAYA
ncbi:MAG: hypothetical protein A2Z59_13955 [Nitrospinae bacterium RIFCSPLOWO2_02_39_17]|nr:MAG: hypothetical protein A2Z59_13955 [Nitrospinae bacterium RIFCSPLOWO2_02_39_17]OHB90888.1 MAG: hypothetical protein A2Z57_01310 [Planctomycetes bacterium RIFCSPHIGHO2_12_39_6]HAP67942.1 YgiT-type zinc finger domain-containing protein [Nitrospinota bacterium]